jgi:hypothetical protein
MAPPNPKSTPNSKAYEAGFVSKKAIVNLNIILLSGPLQVSEFEIGEAGDSL